MKTYLLTAAGVIFLSVIVSLLIPEGKLNKSISFIMRLVCICVLIQPLTGLFTSVGVEDVNTGAGFDYEYVSSVYSEHQSAELGKLIEKEFEISVDCKVGVDYSEGKFFVKGVEVGVSQNNANLIEEIYAYLSELDYINITVYAQST